MSDSDSGVVHAFDQTNGVIPATGEERDGALSGTTSVDTEDATGSSVAVSSGGASAASTADDASGGDADGDAGDSADDGTAVAAAEVADPPAAQTGSADDAGAEPEPATLVAGPGDDAGDDWAATSDLPLPSDADAADTGDEEHTYAVDSAGEAVDEGPVQTDAGAEAPAERSDEPVDDASHTGRLADAYATGPAEEVGGQGSEPVDDVVVVEETSVLVVADDVPQDDAGTAADTAPSDGTGADSDDAVEDTAPIGEAEPSDAGTSRAGSAPGSLSALVGDDDAGHVFDQTNGVADGLDGEGDGTPESGALGRTSGE